MAHTQVAAVTIETWRPRLLIFETVKQKSCPSDKAGAWRLGPSNVGGQRAILTGFELVGERAYTRRDAFKSARLRK
jgi:hypothetical protein